MTISHIATVGAATTSATLSSIVAGDLLMVAVYNNGSTGTFTPPAGWTAIQNVTGANTNNIGTFWKEAAGGETTTGTFTGATHIACSQYRSTLGGSWIIAGSATPSGANTGTTITFPSLTLTKSGSSWVHIAAGSKTSTTLSSSTITATPSETRRFGTSGTGGILVADTNALTSGSTSTASTTQATGAYRATQTEFYEVAPISLSPSSGALTISGQSPVVGNAGQILTPSSGSLAITGQTPVITVAVSNTFDPASVGTHGVLSNGNLTFGCDADFISPSTYVKSVQSVSTAVTTDQIVTFTCTSVTKNSHYQIGLVDSNGAFTGQLAASNNPSLVSVFTSGTDTVLQYRGQFGNLQATLNTGRVLTNGDVVSFRINSLNFYVTINSFTETGPYDLSWNTSPMYAAVICDMTAASTTADFSQWSVVVSGSTVAPSSGALTITGQSPALTTLLNPATGSLTLAGQSPALTTVLTPSSGALAVTGQQPSLSAATSVNPASGALAVTGQSPALTTFLNPATGSLTIAGQAALLVSGLNPASGALVVTGQSAVTALGLNPASGALTITGQSAGLARGLNPASAALTIAGQSPALTTALAPSSGALTITGQQPTIASSFGVSPGAGSLSITGQTPALTTTLTPATGSLSIAGQTPPLTASLSPAAGALVATGQQPTISASNDNTLAPTSGVLVITGQTPTVSNGGSPPAAVFGVCDGSVSDQFPADGVSYSYGATQRVA